LAKIFGSKLSECLISVTEKLYQIYNNIKKVGGLKNISDMVLSLILLIKELSDDVDIATKLAETNQI
jgi:hypothetical protein